MTLPAHPAAAIPSVALAAVAFFADDRNGDSGDRTLIGAGVVLVVLALVILIGLAMDRRSRA
jgi:hypothetical protein